MRQDYSAFLKKFWKKKAPISVLADASDGSVGPELLKLRFPGLRLKVLNGSPNGNFPAHGPNPMKKLSDAPFSAKIINAKADLSAMFDADGDRVVFFDDLGRRIHPDTVALILSSAFRPPYVATLVSGWGFARSKERGEVIFSPTGHVFIKERMKKADSEFGAEPSGHYYFRFKFGNGISYFDSAMRAFVEMASRVSALRAKKVRLSVFVDALTKAHSSGEINIKTKEPKRSLRRIEVAYKKRGRVDLLDGVTVDMGDSWFNIRPSHTENLLRLNAEAMEKKDLAALIKKVKGLI